MLTPPPPRYWCVRYATVAVFVSVRWWILILVPPRSAVYRRALNLSSHHESSLLLAWVAVAQWSRFRFAINICSNSSAEDSLLHRSRGKCEIADTLAMAGACEVPEPSAPLTFLEIFSRTKHQNKTAWITPPSTIGISVLVLEALWLTVLQDKIKLF
ncbi:RNase H domain-containing protein [Trichonephila clavipes]|nr:RNase H domain-containing protein [Trichonephila clavipes]